MSMWFKNFVVDQIVCECSLEFELMNFDIEMLAYENIGLQYYYMGNLEKAKHYHDRAMRGKYEVPGSHIREIC